MFDSLILPVQDHQPSRITRLRRVLGDKALGILVYKVGELHVLTRDEMLLTVEGRVRLESPQIQPATGPIRPKWHKYSVDLSRVQTLQVVTRFRASNIRMRLIRALATFFTLVPGIAAGTRTVLTFLFGAVWLIGCDHGLEPPADPETGFIHARIQYEGGLASWPSPDSLTDLRFVAMQFVPRDTSDFIQLNRMVFSDRLQYDVAEQDITLAGVETGTFVYSGVAQKFGPGLFEWRPVGLITDNEGIFVVSANETTSVDIVVDFDEPPLFPPPLP